MIFLLIMIAVVFFYMKDIYEPVAFVSHEIVLFTCVHLQMFKQKKKMKSDPLTTALIKTL